MDNYHLQKVYYTLIVEVKCNIEKDEIVGKGEFICGDTLDKYSNVPMET